MIELVKISLLYDFYGELLTEKQKKVLDLYYNQDLSLGEIAEELSITRQAVYDNIKRSEKLLNHYEKKLGLVEKFLNQKKKILEIKDKIMEHKNRNISFEEESLKKFLNSIEDVLNDLLID
ncbi:putative DNA-binding protein [Irregularibacter muris]|uniref:UPF0122 protein NSA47_03930 n=1 Tax=Irregularibacter muris TaxID=1796619 RepID=A0AAE3HDK7_9FIRM|nr:putative DNA-binding protein [Irregularibacter muris]MCR1898136.1 putative DNA-binding protein [Irregularibacter muris]